MFLCSHPRTHLLALFQVREARVCPFVMCIRFMLLFCRYNMLGVLVWLCEKHYWTMCGLLYACTRENSGELWFSRPSEHVSPRRDQQRLAQAASREQSLKRDGSHLSEIPHEATVPLFEPSPRRRGLAWARASRLSETLQLERGVGRGQCGAWLFIVLGWLVLGWVWLLWWKTCDELLYMSDMIMDGEWWVWYELGM